MIDKTMPFSLKDERENEMKEILTTVYGALKEKGYNPINQLVGYILSEDPTYITTYNNARSLIRHIDRDEHKKLAAVITAVIFMCGCTAEKTTTGRNSGQTDRGGQTPAEAALLADNTEKVCYGQGYETDTENRPVGSLQAQEKYGEYGGVFIGSKDDKTIYLTFDEGYENGCTGRILDILKSKHEGHEVGNHTCTHPSLPDISNEEVNEELNGLQRYVSENFGGYRMSTMRPPRGEFSVRTLRAAKNAGYATVLWSFAYNDWNVDDQPDRTKAYERITSATHNGAIYLLHAVSETNTAILADVIDYWQENGYTVRSVKE